MEIGLRMSVEVARAQLRNKQKDAVEEACKAVVDKTARQITGLTTELEKLQRACNQRDHQATDLQAKLNQALHELRDREGEGEMYNRDISELKAGVDRLQRANTGVGRNRDYWRHLYDKLNEDLRLASQCNANREVEVWALELANRN